MSTKKIIFLTAGLFLIVLAIISFYLAILDQTSRWYYYAGAILLTLGIVIVAASYIQLAKSFPGKTSPYRLNDPDSESEASSAESAPDWLSAMKENAPQASTSDLLRNAQQSAPQPPLKERQTPQERAFPPDKDQQA